MGRTPAQAAPVAPASGGRMCVLTQADFRPYGTLVWSSAQIHVEQDGETVYCVYRGKSGATGGVELDVFNPAGDTPADVKQTFKTVLGSDPGARYVPENVPGAAESVYALDRAAARLFPVRGERGATRQISIQHLASVLAVFKAGAAQVERDRARA